ncbi:MAG TPA: hypothetical protein VIF11_05965 [Methylomirabilota bacterium]|jgi:hypothetical protein
MTGLLGSLHCDRQHPACCLMGNEAIIGGTIAAGDESGKRPWAPARWLR